MNTSSHSIGRLQSLAIAALLGCTAVPAYGETTDTEDVSPPPQFGTFARLVNRVLPQYPTSRLDFGGEGWVVLSFIVKPDGTTADPVVIDSTGAPEFERAALKAVAEARYSPATWNGVPVEQCQSKIRYVFRVGNGIRGARATFVNTYQRISGLIDAGHLTEAHAEIGNLLSGQTWNLYEDAWLRLLVSRVQNARGDELGRETNLQRATVADGAYLEPKTYQWALRQLFKLQVRLGHQRDALDTYHKLAADAPESEGLKEAAQKIEALIGGPQNLDFSGIVEFRSGCEEGQANWYHNLQRRSFSITEISGNMDKVELRCDWRRVTAKLVLGHVWNAPAEWGNCEVFVFGEPGARVTLVEYPLEDAAAHRPTGR